MHCDPFYNSWDWEFFPVFDTLEILPEIINNDEDFTDTSDMLENVGDMS